MQTIFEKIINREIPADILHEDELFITILDINPVKKGHILLITKEPYPWIDDVPDDITSKAFVRAKKIIQLLKQEFSCDYVHMIVEGLEVPHFHIHLIPSFLSEKNAEWSHESYLNDQEKLDYSNRIKKIL